MNIDMVVIDANKTIGKNPVLVDVTPAYVYENGKRTGEVSGFKYTIALPERAFVLKVATPRLDISARSLRVVCFKHTKRSLYDRG